ncbi:MFS transporter [uncultured Winogradskyella sp.]|uniref:MFS transporter n=1 Tax=uncultured Winogradskyella sp. TaxID=395353 RepID=UPI0030EB1273|tara:strand:+ start:729 stop:2339 length:1611 start_codon:yes stop_codon:yes gene_type:complete
MYNKGLFKDWVPKPVMLLLILAYLFPILIVGGIYTANFREMMSDLAMYSEYLSFANYASFIGMGTALPLLLRFKMRFRSKELMITSLSTIALCSVVIATTDSPYVIIFSNFVIGFFKIIAIIEFVLPLLHILSPDGDRTKFYTIFYPLSITTAQLSTYLFAKIAYNLEWESVYLVMAVIMLILVLVSVIFMHNLRFSRKLPLYQIDLLSMLLFVTSFFLLTYVLVFAKQQDWFNSPYIQGASVGFIITFALLLWRQKGVKRPFVPLTIFKKKNFIQGVTLLMGLGMLLASATIQNTFTVGILGLDSLTNNLLNYAMVPGLVIGAIYARKWYAKRLPTKFLIISGMVFYTLHFVMMYFLISPNVDVYYLIVPSILRGMGMVILFISIWFYALDGFDMAETLAVASLAIVIRSMVSVAFAGAIYSWIFYKLQLQGLENIAHHLDAVSLSPYRGGGLAVYGRSRLQAVLTASKALYGYTIIASMLLIIYTLMLRFEKTHYRRIILIRKLIKGESIKGYNHSVRKATIESISDSAGVVAV